MAPQTTTHYITGPPAHFDLVYSDVWLPPLYSRRILCFKLPQDSSHQRAIEILKRGLQSLVDGTPELGGQVVFVPGEEREDGVPWKALRPGKGIELVVKDLRHRRDSNSNRNSNEDLDTEKFPSYAALESNNFPISAFKDKILVPVPVPIMPLPLPQTVLQANLIEGGLLLCVCLGHELTDGNGMNAIMIALGEQCKLASESEEDLKPRVMNIDRSLMLGLTGSKTGLKDHPAYGYSKGAFVPHDDSHPASENDQASQEAKAGKADANNNEPIITHQHDNEHTTTAQRVKTHTYHIPPPAALALKRAASTPTHPVSTHDALSALMWRTLIHARHASGLLPTLSQEQHDSETTPKPTPTSTYTLPHNARRHLSLPPDWVGNACYFISATLPLSTILAPRSLPTMAASIRAALNAVDGDVVGGLMQLRKECTYDVTWWPLFQIDEPQILMGTSFYHSGLVGVDFGEGVMGRVRHFSCTDEGAM